LQGARELGGFPPPAVAELKGLGAFVEILSGDNDARVQKMACQLGLPCVAGARLADKIGHVEALK